MVQIAVTGDASARVPAERGTAAVRVEASGAERTDVVGRAVARHAELVAEAKEAVASGAATAWEAADVTTGTYDEWVDGGRSGGQKRIRRFRAQARVQVRFRDFAALGAWCLDVAGREDVTLDRISWSLTEATRATVVDDLRARAARDAVARAAAYTAALGLPTPRLTSLWEDGLRPGPGAPIGGGEPRLRAMRASAFDDGGATLELQPQDIELAVALSADFEA
ncbi:SIMPL domain-containing protein [Serinibacter arcticus]|uniref:SIMPL domain-containing protein n=1 Tax=Serinibacter arcticus TaxID=1655435 RepID=A0A4Z1E3W7_9MICO|nr:SIMPL domain-containing protein [Serinibacter arcticus]TGO05462.1 hypothetical protein SERN_1466 [Serinibacter arcticus]